MAMEKPQTSGRSKVSQNRQCAGHTQLMVFVLTFIMLFATLIPCPSQDIDGFKAVGHLQTRRFDIYYAQALKPQAERLTRFADVTLDELVKFFGTETETMPRFNTRIPVLLSDRSPYLNGYSVPYPSNRIVIYLAKDGITNELASLDDELYYVFLHELTHMVTMNMRSPFLAFAAKVFGDFVSPPIWMIPDAILEGTAVWVESNSDTVVPTSHRLAALTTGIGDDSEQAGTEAQQGRLHDPAALEPVFIDLQGDGADSIWTVSGLDDYPGAGSLAYHYGALLMQFLTERFGVEIVSKLWSAAAIGNITKGYDGTLTSKGIVEEITGQKHEVLWSEFLNWLRDQDTASQNDRVQFSGAMAASGTTNMQEATLTGQRVGAFTVGSGELFYVDVDKNAVFSVPLSALLNANAKNPSQKPTRLFAADGLVERLRLSKDGKSLFVDWVRWDATGKIVPALYRFDLQTRELCLVGDRQKSRNWLDVDAESTENDETAHGYIYGLLRQGPAIVPARKAQDGSFEVLEGAPPFVRSLSVYSTYCASSSDSSSPFSDLSPSTWLAKEVNSNAATEGTESNLGPDIDFDSGRDFGLTLAFTQKGGLSQLAIVKKNGPNWVLYMQKDIVQGGIHNPVVVATPSGDVVFYRASLPNGESVLRWIQLTTETLTRSFEQKEVHWMPVLDALQGHVVDNRVADVADTTVHKTTELRPTLFPALTRATRFPYANEDAFGIHLEGGDLSERLTWTTQAGWNYRYGTPELNIGLGFSIDAHQATVSLFDNPFGLSPAEGTLDARVDRISGIALSDRLTRTIGPSWRTSFLNVESVVAGTQQHYVASEFLRPTYETIDFAARFAFGYSALRNSIFAPFDPKGFKGEMSADYEIVPGKAQCWGLSCSGSVAFARPAIQASFYGACALGPALKFGPLGRAIQGDSGTLYGSGLSSCWPSYFEYAALAAGSSWFVYGQAQTRLFTLEANHTLQNFELPFLPSVSLRRVSLFTGVKSGFSHVEGVPEILPAAFLQTKIDGTILAGMASMLHIEPTMELSFPLRPDLAKTHFLLSFGLGVSY